MPKPRSRDAPLAVTMDDVAMTAGVSRATVSRVLSGGDLVIESTREKVLEAVHRLGYLPNIAAQQLARQVSNVIGLLLREPRIHAYGLLHVALQTEIDHAGLQMTTVTPTPGSGQAGEAAGLRQLLGLRVAGLLIASGTAAPDLIAPFRAVVPTVSVGRPEPAGKIHAVSYDDERHGVLLGTAVADVGHQRVGVVMVDADGSISEYMRSQNMAHSLRQRGVTVFEVAGSRNGDAIPTRERATELLRLVHEHGVTAAMFPNDLGALEFMEQAVGAGIRVPEDVAVTGCDGVIPGIEYMGLATVRIPVEQVAQRGVAVMAGLLEADDEADVVQERHAGYFMPGRSLAPPAADPH